MSMRAMALADLDTVLGWAAAEGWNPGLDDAAAFMASDPGGFFVAVRDGQPVAAISVVNHDAGNAFLGLYIVRPGWRGQGIGLDLWQRALAHAGGRTVGLDGVEAQQANYARSGFVPAGGTIRWSGQLAAASDDRVRPVAPPDAGSLARLDSAAIGHDRAAFRRAWLADTETRRTVVLEGPNGPDGFATLRMCRNGVKIGPLVAPDAARALVLVRAGLACLPAAAGAPVTLDVPDRNTGLSGLLSGLGLVAGFRTARMYRGTAPVQGSALQAVGTLELG